MADEQRYLVKEIFGPTIQGEGAHAGTSCVFLRFAGCNLACAWCDTDFAPEGAERRSAGEIAKRLGEVDVYGSKRVVVTGGEPALAWDDALARALKTDGFRVHMETNGTRPLRSPVDWLTVSPKPRFHGADDELVLLAGDECKVVIDETISDEELARYEALAFAHFFAQPCMNAAYPANLKRTLELIARRPKWRLSVQLHKVVGLP